MKRLVVIAVGLTAALAGCGNLDTQISTLKPVAGDAVTELNIAAIDVLLAHEVQVLVAPVCRFEAETYTCAGTAAGNEPISVTASGSAPETFTVKVGSETVYDGSIDAVIERAGRR